MINNKYRKYIINFVIIFVLLITGVISFTIVNSIKSEKHRGESVYVSINDKVTHSFPLDTDIEFKIQTQYGYNILVINNKRVRIKDADCPDKICVNHKDISFNGEDIICIPHKLVINIR